MVVGHMPKLYAYGHDIYCGDFASHMKRPLLDSFCHREYFYCDQSSVSVSFAYRPWIVSGGSHEILLDKMLGAEFPSIPSLHLFTPSSQVASSMRYILRYLSCVFGFFLLLSSILNYDSRSGTLKVIQLCFRKTRVSLDVQDQPHQIVEAALDPQIVLSVHGAISYTASARVVNRKAAQDVDKMNRLYY